MRLGVLILCLAAALAGCRVGPNYHRPNVHPPPQFRDGEPNPTQVSLGNVKWFDLFQDDVLRGLIKQALVANYDILIAAQRVIAAQGQFIATRSTLYPRLDGESSASRSNIAAAAQSQSDVLAILSWEADLFGRLRRATEAARADALAAEENQETVIQTLIAQVASAYFDLRELDAELEIVRESIKFRQYGGRGHGHKPGPDRAVRCHRSGENSDGDGESHQFPPRQAAWTGCARVEPCRSAAACGSAGRTAVQPARTPSGPAGCRTGNGCGQRPRRCCQSGIFSEPESHCGRRCTDERPRTGCQRRGLLGSGDPRCPHRRLWPPQGKLPDRQSR